MRACELIWNCLISADGMGGILNGVGDDERERATPDLEIGTLSRNGNHYSSRQYPPDLLAFSGIRGSSPISQASTAPDNSRLFNQNFNGSFGSPWSLYVGNSAGTGGGFKTLPHNRSGAPYSISNGSAIPVLPRQGYVTIPRRPRAPSWSSGPPISPTETDELVEPVYDNLGQRTTADGSSAISLNKSPEPAGGGPMRNRPLPGTPNQQTISHSAQRSALNISPLDRAAPEGAAEWSAKIDDEMDNRNLQQQQQQQPHSVGFGSLGRKVPPRPPPKPKKKSNNGPLYEDEGEDGTEV